MSSGCVAADLSATPEPTAPGVLDWTLTDCRAVVAIVPVDAAALADRMPEGFRSLSPAEIGLPDDPRGDANLGIESFVCADGVVYGSLFSFVEPPADLVDPDAKFHFVKWDTLVHDATLRDALATAGAPVLDGSASWTRWEGAGDATSFDGTLEMGGAYGFDGTALAPAPDDMRAFTFVEFTPTPAGLVVWKTHATTTTAGQGGVLVDLPAGWARDAVGAQQAQAYALAFRGSFEGGSVRLPTPAS